MLVDSAEERRPSDFVNLKLSKDPEMVSSLFMTVLLKRHPDEEYFCWKPNKPRVISGFFLNSTSNWDFSRLKACIFGECVRRHVKEDCLKMKQKLTNLQTKKSNLC